MLGDRKISDYPGYTVTVDGRVWSDKSNRFLKMYKTQKGYYVVKLTNSREDQWTVAVHRLVATIHVDGYSKDKQVNHINGNKLDNNAGNLEWVTGIQNIRHSWRTGLHRNDDRRGERNASSKLRGADVIGIRQRLKDGAAQRDIAEQFGVDKTLISQINKGKIWRHV